jgi:acyl-CoA synthetase (AMP-forming)/AMP-acid ligase II
MRQLVNHLKNQPPPSVVSQLRQVFTGGDVVPADLLRDMAEVFPQSRLVVGYGPTEGTIICTAYHVSRDQAITRPPLGKPLANMSVRLYDKQAQLVPLGVLGELYLGGRSVARGYLNQAELTAEKFVVIDGERFYRTGDLARYLEDGNLEFAGRVDQQVKIRGYRVETEEIESVLGEHSGVRECVVTARSNGTGEKQLVAYVVPNGRVPNIARTDGKSAREAADEEIQLWPSIGEFFVFDELIYYGLTNDEDRNRSYKVAIERVVKDKIVVDIGTGRDAIQARFCAEAGAKRVYAIDIGKS